MFAAKFLFNKALVPLACRLNYLLLETGFVLKRLFLCGFEFEFVGIINWVFRLIFCPANCELLFTLLLGVTLAYFIAKGQVIELLKTKFVNFKVIKLVLFGSRGDL